MVELCFQVVCDSQNLKNKWMNVFIPERATTPNHWNLHTAALMCKTAFCWFVFSSGGVQRDWAGVPRTLFSPGSGHTRCVCVQLDDPTRSNNPNLQQYKDCPPEAESCPLGWHPPFWDFFFLFYFLYVICGFILCTIIWIDWFQDGQPDRIHLKVPYGRFFYLKAIVLCPFPSYFSLLKVHDFGNLGKHSTRSRNSDQGKKKKSSKKMLSAQNSHSGTRGSALNPDFSTSSFWVRKQNTDAGDSFHWR